MMGGAESRPGHQHRNRHRHRHRYRHRCRHRGNRLALLLGVVLAILVHVATAAVIRYDLNVSWTLQNPDGQRVRPVISVNGGWPPPTLHATVGDRLVVRLRNQLGNQSTSLHFHGLFMRGAAHMDGAVQVAQCAVPPGLELTYDFTVDQPGTYWYHSHDGLQYVDGLRAPLVVHNPDAPFRFDEERVLSLSDWYHTPAPVLLRRFRSKRNPTGVEPVPSSVLLNDTQAIVMPMDPGVTYLVRVVNMAAFAGQYLWFEGHNMTVVEVDGVYTRPRSASMLYFAPGQRYSFLLVGRNDTNATNYAFQTSMDTAMFAALPPGFQGNATGYLVYDVRQPMAPAAPVDVYAPLDDAMLAPRDNMTLLARPDVAVSLDVHSEMRRDGASYAFFNNVTYLAPRVPTLYTVLSAASAVVAADPRIYGASTQTVVVPHRGQVVQLVVNNHDPRRRHAVHLHGHNFQVAYRSPPGAGPFPGAVGGGDTSPSRLSLRTLPIRRDTLLLNAGGFAVLRFRADNPGVWLFQCHIQWHMAAGLMATLVEAPADLRRHYQPANATVTSPAASGVGALPVDQLAACAAGGVPTIGNAAGNAANFFDLVGEAMPPPPLPDGFTRNGLLALAFSCLSGVAGVVVVTWYGQAGADELGKTAPHGAAKQAESSLQAEQEQQVHEAPERADDVAEYNTVEILVASELEREPGSAASQAVERPGQSLQTQPPLVGSGMGSLDEDGGNG